MDFDSKEFKKLQKQWYDKLKKDGKFQEIEDNRGHNNVKQSHQSHFYKYYSRGKLLNVESTQSYYYKAGQFATEYEFDKPIEKKAWLLHADGVSYREIAKKCRINLFRVFSIIKKYRSIFLNEYLDRYSPSSKR